MSDTDISTVDRGITPGSEATVREITQQPEIWREAAAKVAAQRRKLDAFLQPLLERSSLRVVLTGAGTSAFVGGVVAPSLSRLLNRRIDALATTDIVSNPREFFAEDLPTLLVSFARSGNSPESIAATRLADQYLSDVSHLVLTCDETGHLFREHEGRDRSRVVLMPEGANDEGFAMTSSFTSMLLSILLIMGGENDSAVNALSTAATAIIQTRQNSIRDLAESGYARIVYLGSGPLTALARESALKLLELTAGRIVTYFDSPLGFRHGPKAVLDDRTLVIVFVSSDEYTRQYDLDIIAELRTTAGLGRVMGIASEPLLSSPQDVWVLDGLEGLDDSLLAVGYVVFAQILGLSFALHLKMSPDNPFPGGGVNRVVKGVSIHPLARLSDDVVRGSTER